MRIPEKQPLPVGKGDIVRVDLRFDIKEKPIDAEVLSLHSQPYQESMADCPRELWGKYHTTMCLFVI